MIFGVTLAACSNPEISEEGIEDDQPQATNEIADSELRVEKLNYYVDCINAFSGNISDSQERYLSWVDPEVGPTGQESYAYGLFDVYRDSESCLTGIKAASEIDVDNQLNAPGESYAKALETAEPLIKEAYEYYDQENYLDDEFVKGKEIHTSLLEAFDAFDKADTELRAQMEPIENEVDLAMLEVFKENGDGFGYAHQNLILKAGDLADLGGSVSFETIDLETLMVALEQYEVTLEEMTTYAEENKEEMTKVSLYSMMESDAESLLKSAKDLMRLKRDNPDDLEGGTEAIDDFIEEYNGFISSSNSIFRR